MSEFLQLVARLSIPAFIVSSMLAMGLALTWRQVVTPLKQRRLVALTLLVNFIISPALAYLLSRLLRLERAHAIGLILLGAAAGAPFLPKLAQLAHVDLALSVALMALLTAVTILFMPIALPLMIPGFQTGAWTIARPLLVMMVVPLILAMIVRHFAERFSIRCQPLMNAVANVSLLQVFVLLIARNARDLAVFIGSGALLAALLLFALSFAAGYLLCGSGVKAAGAAGLAAGARNVGAALPVASVNGDSKVVVMLLAGTLVGLVVLVAAALFLRRRAREFVG